MVKVTAAQRHEAMLNQQGAIRNRKAEAATMQHSKRKVNKICLVLPRTTLITIYSLIQAGKVQSIG